APENTLAGFRAAAAAGARWVEFDVKLTRDGVAVLMHDETLERTTNGRGRVAETPLAAIAALDAGAWFGAGFRDERVPTLLEAFAELGRLGLGANIEIKPCPGRADATAAAVVAAVAAHWPAALPPPLVSSFAPECLAMVRDRAAHLPRGLLVGRLPQDWRRQVEALGCASVNLGRRHASAAAIAEVLASGLALVMWTVNEAVEAARLLAAGASAIITDRPDGLMAARV
ncbi:MAG: glycerophosphodiester phosphodiesterase, partial [Proteobacteria bacterium]|nr:glycerophosphodiester phosphodiesterase [Pseudomonadota bacterium]